MLDTPEGGGLRMVSETLTVESAVVGLLADPRFAEARQRCAVLVEWRCVTREQYAAVGACRSYAYDAYRWPDVASGE